MANCMHELGFHYKRHLIDKQRLQEEDIQVCVRCGKVKYELESGGVRWIEVSS